MTMILLPGGLFHQGDLLQYQDLLVLMVCLPILRVVYLFSRKISSEVGVAEPFSWPEREEQADGELILMHHLKVLQLRGTAARRYYLSRHDSSLLSGV